MLLHSYDYHISMYISTYVLVWENLFTFCNTGTWRCNLGQIHLKLSLDSDSSCSLHQFYDYYILFRIFFCIFFFTQFTSLVLRVQWSFLPQYMTLDMTIFNDGLLKPQRRVDYYRCFWMLDFYTFCYSSISRTFQVYIWYSLID